MLFEDVHQSLHEQWNTWKEQHPVRVDTSTLPLDGRGCPMCGHANILHRKRTNDYRCRHSSGGVFCDCLFTTPIPIIDPLLIRTLETEAKQRRLNDFNEAHQVGKQAALLAIDQDIRYLSMEDTITLCKRCAFVADRTKMVLCDVCKEKYHAKSYDRCSSCAGVETKPKVDTDVMKDLEIEPEENPYHYGSLLIMNVTKDGFGIAVPMNALTKQQRATLEDYLGKGDYKEPGRRKGPYLIWEAWNWTDGGVLIDCIKLTDAQYQESLRLYEGRGRSNSGV